VRVRRASACARIFLIGVHDVSMYVCVYVFTYARVRCVGV